MAAFTPGNIVVYRLGTGAAALSSAATAAFLDEYTPAGVLVQSIALPIVDAGSNQTLTNSGTATSEGLISLTADGQFILVTGYDAAPGTASVASTTAPAILRVVGRIAADGSVDTSTTLNGFSTANNIRSAAGSNGTDFYAAGATGVGYTSFQSALTPTSIAAQNTRQLGIFDGQLYETSGSGAIRVATIGAGTPTTAGQTVTNLPGIPTTGTSPYGFFFADLTAAVAGVDTLYIADDSLGLQKYSLVAGSWTLNGTVGANADDYRGLTAGVSGGTVTLYATRDNGGGADTIVSIVDSSGYNANFSSTAATTVATAATNTAFRGIVLAPQAASGITISINDVAQAEGDSGTPIFAFTISLSAPAPAGGVTLDVAVAPGTASAGIDYVTTGVTGITIAAGTMSTTVNITARGDTTVEPDETFFVNLTNVVGATVLDGQGQGTINNDDVVSETQTLTITANVTRAELNSGVNPFTFTITRTGGTTGTLNYSGSFAFGAGVNGADFISGNAPVFFSGQIPVGQTSRTLVPNIAGDTTIEANETFTITLETATNAAPGVTTVIGAANVGTGTILNDDAGPTIGGVTVFAEAPSLAGNAITPVATGDLSLIRIGSFAGTGTVAAGRAEATAYDPATGRLYITNASRDVANVPQGRIDVLQINADGTATLQAAGIVLTALPEFGTVNSVALRGGIVAIAYDNVTFGQPGRVVIYSTSNLTTPIANVVVGVLPDQITFTPNGNFIFVANEGEQVFGSNPAGTISVIDVTTPATAAVVRTIDFTALDGFEAALQARGVALITGQSAANDIEPEYITISPDGTRAYVVLQEVNSVAVLDITSPATATLLSIQPLGGVDHNLVGNAFDPSDRDNGSNGPAINLINANVISLLQPDAITSYAVGGFTYFVTANEGDARVTRTAGGAEADVGEVLRLSSTSYVLDPTIYPNAATTFKLDSQLGRLNVNNVRGDIDLDGDFDQIYNIGGRSFSIFRQNLDGTITKVRETGGEFEAILARDYASIFNVNQNSGPIDARSDDKGPEPEGVTIGTVGGRIYAFVTLERVGGVMTYDITDPANAFFVGFTPPSGSDFGPETTLFIDAGSNPTNQPLLVTANEISGTTTVYRIVQATAGADTVTGGAFNDVISGNGGNDFFNLIQGGDDRVSGGAGNDGFQFGASFTTADFVDGGEGTNDQLGLQGTYTGGSTLTLSAANLVNTEVVAVLPGAGFNYSITTTDDLIADGATMRFYAASLLAGQTFTLNGAAETNGRFLVYGGAGSDTITTGAGNDGIYFGPGAFNAATDFVNGGAGTNDQVAFDGSFSGTIGGGNFQNIEVLALLLGIPADLANYNITVADSLLTGTALFTISGIPIQTALTVNGAAEATGSLRIFGGTAGDTLIGGGGNDILYGNSGNDTLTGNGGADQFLFANVPAPGNVDQITDFSVPQGDKIGLDQIAFAMPAGSLAVGAFVIGTQALDADDRIIYDQATGALFFDADGNGAGVAIQIATLSNTPVLSAADFVIV